jgi:hypothetical protein
MNQSPVRSLLSLAALLAIALAAAAQVVVGPTVRSPGTMPAPMQPPPQAASAYTGNVVSCVVANPPAGTSATPLAFTALSWSFTTPSAPPAAQAGRSPYVGLWNVRTPFDANNNALLSAAFTGQTLFSSVTVTIYKAGAVTGQVVLHNAVITGLKPESAPPAQMDELVTFAYQSAG